MTATLLITILAEGIVAVVYSVWQKKAILPILLTSSFANLITQSFLWIVLRIFFRPYLIALIGAEILIWIVEGIFLSSVPATRLDRREAMLLSLMMNTMSFGLGWFLPV